MTTKNLYIGWDVGAWHCTPYKSCDALCLIQENESKQYEIIGHARENLSASIQTLFLNHEEDSMLENLLKSWVKLCLAGRIKPGELEDKTNEILDVSTITIAIDASLGWSIHLQNLLNEKKWEGGNIYRTKEIESPVLFRETERIISKDGHNPKSVMTHMIGSQSTKGLAFVRSRCFKKGFCRWKSKYKNTIVIETYPAATYTSIKFLEYIESLNLIQSYKTNTSETDSFDAAICACIALIYRKRPEKIRVNYPTCEHRNFKSEGWIFVPKKSDGDFERKDTNKCVNPNTPQDETFHNAVGSFKQNAMKKKRVKAGKN